MSQEWIKETESLAEDAQKRLQHLRNVQSDRQLEIDYLERFVKSVPGIIEDYKRLHREVPK